MTTKDGSMTTNKITCPKCGYWHYASMIALPAGDYRYWQCRNPVQCDFKGKRPNIEKVTLYPFSKVEELKAKSEADYDTIFQQQAEISELKKENERLKKEILEKKYPNIRLESLAGKEKDNADK